jgi:hypothetical protein
MKLGWKDAVATLLVAAIGIPYGFYLALGGVTFIQNGDGSTAVGILDPTGMSALALILGAIAAVVGGWIVLGEGTVTGYVTAGLGVVSAVLGVLALIGENLFNNSTIWESVLGAFMASIALLWAIAVIRHSGVLTGSDTQAPARLTSV